MRDLLELLRGLRIFLYSIDIFYDDNIGQLYLLFLVNFSNSCIPSLIHIIPVVK